VRIEAWQEELDPAERLAFEVSARRALVAHGYTVNPLWREMRIRGPFTLMVVMGQAWAAKLREWGRVLADFSTVRRYSQNYRLRLINLVRRVTRG
jgi:hypothetical protein